MQHVCAVRGKIYTIYHPKEAVGVWVGYWAKIFPSLNGEKKTTLEAAISHAQSEQPGDQRERILVRVAQ